MFKELSTLQEKKLSLCLRYYFKNFNIDKLEQDKFFHEFFKYSNSDIYFFKNLLAVLFYKYIEKKLNRYYNGFFYHRSYIFHISEINKNSNKRKYMETLKKYNLLKFGSIRKIKKNEDVRLYEIDKEVKFQALIVTLDYLDIIFNMDNLFYKSDFI